MYYIRYKTEQISGVRVFCHPRERSRCNGSEPPPPTFSGCVSMGPTATTEKAGALRFDRHVGM